MGVREHNHKQPHATVVIIPGSPALIPDLGTGDHAGAIIRETINELLTPFVSAKSGLATLPVYIICSHDCRFRTNRTGSFAAWGAPDTTVSSGNFLSELIARYFLESASVAITEPVVTDKVPSSPFGLIVVVVDGSAGLTARAPLSLLPNAVSAHRWCEKFLADPQLHYVDYSDAWLSDAGVLEPQLWSELQKMAPKVTKATLLHSDSSLGVGRYVARWEVHSS